MDWLWWLCLGALIAWVAEWAWDWFWFRRRHRVASVDVEARLSALHSERERLTADLQTCAEQRARLEGDLVPLRARVVALEPLEARAGHLGAENERLRLEIATAHERAAERDRELLGLRADLGAAMASGAEHEVALIGLRADMAVTQANATEHDVALAWLAGLRAELATAQAHAVEREAELAGLRAELGALGIENERLRSDLASGAAGLDGSAGLDRGGAPALNLGGGALLADAEVERVVGGSAYGASLTRLRDSNAQLHHELEATRRTLVRLGDGRGDPLIDIDGIGPVYQQHLYAAGVVSFEQLAAMSPEAVRAIIKPERWQQIDPGAWIAEAARFAAQVRAGTYPARNG